MTGSDIAFKLLASWKQALEAFWRVAPEAANQATQPLRPVVASLNSAPIDYLYPVEVSGGAANEKAV
jgi:hypothetical protein